MILLVDIGNSVLHWSLLREGHPLQPSAIAHTDTDAMSALQRQWRKLATPTRVLVADVALAPIGQWLLQWCKSVWKISPEFVQSKPFQAGVVNGYQAPPKLGVDRWLALIAAYKQFSVPLCVVDCGSAITIDTLDENGAHRGGVILPGIRLMQKAITDNTKLMIEPSYTGDVCCFAKDTRAAVFSGVLYTAAAAIDRIVIEAETTLRLPCTRILCGGDAAQLTPLLKQSYQPVSNLVLHGLAVVAAEEDL